MYDKPMRSDASSAVYRPSRTQETFNEDEYEKLVCSDEHSCVASMIMYFSPVPSINHMDIESFDAHFFSYGSLLSATLCISTVEINGPLSR